MLGIYCRTSKSRKNKYTIENQRDNGIACANVLGISFRIYIDDGISGTLDETVRDGLSDLINDIRRKEITHVYCIDQSRIERDSRTWDFFVAECLNNNIQYYPGGTHFELESSTNRMYANLMSVVNAYYSEITSKKVRLANARKARFGKTHGLKAYGYRRDANNDYIVYEPEAENVRRMFKLSSEGYGTYSIANIFNNEGIPTKFSGNFKGEIRRKEKFTRRIKKFDKSKVRWRGNVIYDMLKNEIYKGIRKWRRFEDRIKIIENKTKKIKEVVEEIIAAVPPIIDVNLWDQVNDNLKYNKKNVGKKAIYKYLLNELIICADCGKYFVGKKRLSSGDNAYKCQGKIYPSPNCKTSRGISINKLDSFIIKHLFKSKSLEQHLKNLPKDNRTKNNLISRLSNEKGVLQQVNKKLETAYKRLLNPEFQNDEYIESQVIELKSKKAKQKVLVDNLEANVNTLRQNMNENRTHKIINSYFEGISFDDLRKLIHSLIEYIKIKHEKSVGGKGGNFIIEIKYKGYEEKSIFLTDWKAIKWMWASYYRGHATNVEQLEEDRESTLGLMEYLEVKMTKNELNKLKKKRGLTDEEIAKMDPQSDDFVGTEVYIGFLDTINLSKEEIVYFD